MSFPHPIRSLAELPDLAGLLDVCKKFDIEITAFGSLVRRLARRLVASSEGETDAPFPDLFELAPFLSDIDLRHTGPARKTLAIRRAILEAVPFSECFRWEIFSEEELKDFTEDEVHLPVIAVNKLRLATRAGGGITDPFDGYRDFRSREYRLLRSPWAHRSRLYREYRDSEFIPVLQYLRVIFEEPHPASTQPGWPVAQQIAHEVKTPALLAALEESARLRARFRYRSKALRASCRSEALWNKYLGSNGIGPTIDYINELLPFPVLDLGKRGEGEAIRPGDLLISSCRLGGDQFRLRTPLISHALQDKAEVEWHELRENARQLNQLTNNALPKLLKGQKIVADTPEFRINLGEAVCAFGDEQLHFQVPLTAACAAECQAYGDTRLGAFMLLGRELAPAGGETAVIESVALPLPSVCWLVPEENGNPARLQIRTNCGRLLESIPSLLWERQPLSHSTFRIKLYVVAES